MWGECHNLPVLIFSSFPCPRAIHRTVLCNTRMLLCNTRVQYTYLRPMKNPVYQIRVRPELLKLLQERGADEVRGWLEEKMGAPVVPSWSKGPTKEVPDVTHATSGRDWTEQVTTASMRTFVEKEMVSQGYAPMKQRTELSEEKKAALKELKGVLGSGVVTRASELPAPRYMDMPSYPQMQKKQEGFDQTPEGW